MKTKRCNICQESRPLDEMVIRRNSKSGRGPYCRPCESKRTSAWGQKNKAKRKAIVQRYALKNPRMIWAQSSLAQHKRKGNDVQVSTKGLWALSKTINSCKLCNITISWERNGKCKPNSPTMDRVDNSNIVTLDTIMIICHKCNTTKGARTMKEFIDYCKNIAQTF